MVGITDWIQVIVTIIAVGVTAIAAKAARSSARAANQMVEGNRLNRRAMEQWSKTLVQPKIIVRGSSRSFRESFRERGLSRLLGKNEIMRGDEQQREFSLL